MPTTNTIEVAVQPVDGPRYFKNIAADNVLAELQAIVGGFIEVVYSLPNNPGDILIVDEEGLLKERPLNYDASRASGRTIVGTAVFMADSDFE